MVTKKEIIGKYITEEDLQTFQLLDLTGYDKTKPTLLFIDDYDSIVSLFRRLVKRMNLTTDMNVVFASEYDAIFKTLRTLYEIDDFYVDFVISDITFNGNIQANLNSYSFSGIKLVGILKKINFKLIYKFITGHRISPKGTASLFEEYAEYAKDDLFEHVEFKDKPISTDKELVYGLFRNTEYEKYIK